MSNEESVSLYFSDGRSDKEYHAQLAQKDAGYVVNFQYGRRGNSLTSGTKTPEPVDYAKAKKAFDALVKAKMKKGYSPGESGTPYEASGEESRFLGILPQLLNPIEEEALNNYLANPGYVMQEKFDGVRFLLKREGSEVTGINRKGLSVGFPSPIKEAALTLACESCVIDGERLGDVVKAFDLLELDGVDLRELPYKDRLSRLEALIGSTGTISVVESVYSTADKLTLLDRVEKAHGEGVVIKHLFADFEVGRPASLGPQLKFKFVESATCEVDAIHETKRSVSLRLYDGSGNSVAVGNVTIPANHEVPQAGAIVEVRYLYAYKGGSLYQPVYLGIREDQAASDCLTSQLKYKRAA